MLAGLRAWLSAVLSHLPCLHRRATVVAGVLLQESAAGPRVLLEQRSFGWAIPGGKVEAGESGAAAVRRELLEELGLTSTKVEPFGPQLSGAHGHTVQHYVVVRWTSAYTASDLPAGVHALPDAGFPVVQWVPEPRAKPPLKPR